MKSFLQFMDQCPPYVVRRVARRGKKWVPAEVIAKHSGLSVATVMRYARMKSWSTIPVAKAQAFAAACGHDLRRPSKTISYLEGTTRRTNSLPFSHLPPFAQRQFTKLLKRYG